MTEKAHRNSPLATVAILFAAVVLYILSTGPSAWLIGRCGFPEWLLVPYEVLYKPVDMAHERLPGSVTAPLDRYIGWWLADFLPPVAKATGPVSPRLRPTAAPTEPEASGTVEE